MTRLNDPHPDEFGGTDYPENPDMGGRGIITTAPVEGAAPNHAPDPVRDEKASAQVVSSLLRLFRAGDEYSKQTAKLKEATIAIGSALLPYLPVGEPLRNGYKVLKRHTSLDEDKDDLELIKTDDIARHTIAVTGRYQAEFRPLRRAALVFCEDIAHGLLDDWADYITRDTTRLNRTIVEPALAGIMRAVRIFSEAGR